jgi:transposase
MHRIAGIDVHKKMLAVVVTDVAEEGKLRFDQRRFDTTAGSLNLLRQWLEELDVKEVVMESTAQYWRPVWAVLEPKFHLELAQAQSNRAPRGRKTDFGDAERLVKRFLADELILSFVPAPEQRVWRTLGRTRTALARDRARLQNRLEAMLEEMRIRISSVVTDLFGLSARRMLQALAEGETNPAAFAPLAEKELRAKPEKIAEAFSTAAAVDKSYRGLLRQSLERLETIERHIREIDKELAEAMREHDEAVTRLAEVPGIGADAAQRIIAETGPQAVVFPTPEDLCSWVGTCPGSNISAEKSKSDRSPKGNHQMRHLLNQSANAAARSKGTVFEAFYQKKKRGDPKRHGIAVWAVANKLCRIIWKVLHDGVRYQERGNRPKPEVVRQRLNRVLRNLRKLGYEAILQPLQRPVPA